MLYRRMTEVIGALGLLAVLSAPALADSEKAKLIGDHEVPLVLTTGEGTLTAKLTDRTTIEFELTYSGLEGTVTQAHIHIGQRNVNGGIVLFFCSNVTTPTPPPGTPACPGPHAGTVTGTLTAADVVAVPTQGVSAGDIGLVIDAIREGKAYANVHSDMSPAGEIRGQIK